MVLEVCICYIPYLKEPTTITQETSKRSVLSIGASETSQLDRIARGTKNLRTCHILPPRYEVTSERYLRNDKSKINY